MKKGLVKYFSFVSLLFIFLFSGVSLARASSPELKSPYYYVFELLLRTLNLTVGSSSCVQFADAYEGYLEVTNNQAMLDKLEEYKSLSWNDTISDINPLFESLYRWVSLSPSYGTDFSSFSYTSYFELPSSPDPFPSSIGMEGVQTVPFSDVNASSIEGYTYLYSDSYLDVDENGRQICVRRNIYAPDGKEIVSSFSSSGLSIRLDFNCLDNGEIKNVTLKSISTSYYMDTYSIKHKDVDFSDLTQAYYRIRSIMNLPFYVFSASQPMFDYRVSGVPDHVCTNNTAALWGIPFYDNLFFLDVDSMYLHKLVLPSGYSFPLLKRYSDSDSFLSALQDAGLDIADRGTYTLEIYKENIEGDFIKEKTENLIGGVGRTPYISSPVYPNFSLQEDLTTPKDGVVLENGSLTIKLYYTRDRIDYKVEHYQQNREGTDWLKKETESLTGLLGAEASFTAKDYPGFTFAEGLTEPDNRIISADSELTIKLYYLRDLISYTVEHYQQEVDESGKQG